MTDVVYAARSLVDSNLGWFYVTRQTLGENTGNERAININKSILDEWFDLPSTLPTHLEIHTRYYDGKVIPGTYPSTVVSDDRTIRNQGGGKNWRLAGPAIEGVFYDVRAGDIMFMAFHRPSRTLAWVVIRQSSDTHRTVPNEETSRHGAIKMILGLPLGNMWSIEHRKAALVIDEISVLYESARELLMANNAFIGSWINRLASVGFRTSNDAARRLALSLQAKRFLILTGLSGSGKTLLARAFVRWICASSEQYKVIPVGANWVSNENILGYPDALDPTKYQKTDALEVLIRAITNPDEPHFIILDEMNLSHVERYFADFLSAIESADESFRFHHDAALRSDIPPKLDGFPSNLFVIGTVNVDETTYMFSPKVLDRANVIEFRTSPEELDKYLQNPVDVNLKDIDGKGKEYSKHLIDTSNERPIIKDPRIAAIVRAELVMLFQLLERHDIEFGFRTVSEILRYLEFQRRTLVSGEKIDVDQGCRDAIDVQVMQKILTRLHGSRRRLEPVVIELLGFCSVPREWAAEATPTSSLATNMINNYSMVKAKMESIQSGDEASPSPMYPISFEKLCRFRKKLESDGFASYAEA